MKIFFLEHNSIFHDIKKEFEVVNKIEDADRVLLWNDVLPVERGIVNLAHSLGKKVIVLQHGRKGTSRYYPPFSEPIQADILLVWGEFDKQELIKAGQDEKKIKVVGSPVMLHLKERKKHYGTNIVYCPEHWDRPIDENIQVRNKLRNFKGVVTKIIETHDPKDFDNPIQTNRNSEDHLDICAEILSVADLVVSVYEGTFELMAQAMDIPVVVMSDWSPKAFNGDLKHTEARRFYTSACKTTSLKNLVKTIKRQLKNPNELKEQRKQAAIMEGGYGLNFIENVKREIVG